MFELASSIRRLSETNTRVTQIKMQCIQIHFKQEIKKFNPTVCLKFTSSKFGASKSTNQFIIDNTEELLLIYRI